MKRKIVIEYNWHCSQFKKVPKELEEFLEESAMDRVIELIRKGYTSGELSDNINTDIAGHETPEDGYECSGWWKVSYK